MRARPSARPHACRARAARARARVIYNSNGPRVYKEARTHGDASPPPTSGRCAPGRRHTCARFFLSIRPADAPAAPSTSPAPSRRRACRGCGRTARRGQACGEFEHTQGRARASAPRPACACARTPTNLCGLPTKRAGPPLRPSAPRRRRRHVRPQGSANCCMLVPHRLGVCSRSKRRQIGARNFLSGTMRVHLDCCTESITC